MTQPAHFTNLNTLSDVEIARAWSSLSEEQTHIQTALKIIPTTTHWQYGGMPVRELLNARLEIISRSMELLAQQVFLRGPF